MAKKIGLLLGPVFFLFFFFFPCHGLPPKAEIVLGLATWMVVWWITEAVSISVTALLPLAIFLYLIL